MKLSALCMFSALTVWVVNQHPVAFVAVGVSAFALLVATDRANRRDDGELAPFSEYQGIDR